MKYAGKLFAIGCRQVARDGMLAVLLPAPFFVGAFFRFALPLIDTALRAQTGFSLAPWYRLVDGMLICLAPMFTAMIAAFLLLEERDEGLGAFYQVTPAVGGPYLLARIGLPLAWAFLATAAVAAWFHLSPLSLGTILAGALVSSLTAAAMAMMVAALAGNRVEGLALSKLMGIGFVGLLFVWFVPAPTQFLAAFLPSFWIGKIAAEGVTPLSLLLGALSGGLWTAFFTGLFLRRG